MSGNLAYGLEWQEAEIDLAAWQGITALRFAPIPPAGVAAELIVELAKEPNGLVPDDLDLTAPNGGVLECVVQPLVAGVREMRIHFATIGPRGMSRTHLRSGGADPLHPFFTEASFDFYIDCPAGDCRTASAVDPGPPGAAPAIDLATKDFAGFVKVAQDWALSTDPNWSDLTPASTEQMLVELLAHHAEMLSLHQDRVAQEAFIDTARERLSLRRHAAFLGLALYDGVSATTTVAVDVGPGAAGYLPRGCRIVRQEEQGRITSCFVTTATALVDRRWNAGLGSSADAGLLRLAAWPGARDAALPQGTAEILLLDWTLGLAPGQRIALIQGTDAHVARLTEVDEMTAPGWADDPETPPGLAPRQITRIAWDAPTAVRFTPWADLPAKPFLVTANLVDVIHGEPHTASNRAGAGVIPLAATRRDAVFATDPATGVVQLRALRTPEADILIEPDSRPSLSLTIGGTQWDWQPDLWTSAGFDRHFTTEREDDGAVWLILGDGTRGAAVPAAPGPTLPEYNAADPNSLITLSYRRGAPQDGNIGAFALNAVLPPESDPVAEAELAALDVQGATNLLAATGGRQAVSLDVARQLIPESIRHPARERCVTAEDYARAAEDISGIAQAAAKPLGGLFNTIAVLCAPDEGDNLTETLRAEVFDRLDTLRMAGREHMVRAPDYVPLDIALLVCPAQGAGAAAIRSAVRAALVPGAAAAPGFFHRSRRGFGAEVRIADILAAVARAPGVGAVCALAFRPLLETGGGDVRRAIRLSHTEIAQFAGDEARPERGRLTVRIEGIDRPEPPGAFRVGGPASEPLGDGGTP